MSTTKKTKVVNTRRLSIAVADFVKIYNIDLITSEPQNDKKEAEKKLVNIILEEINKYDKYDK